MAKEKQKHKTKEQLLAEAEQQRNVQRLRDKVNKEVTPILLELPIEKAKMVCQTSAIAIKQSFNNKMTEMKVSDLKLLEGMNQKAPDYEVFKNFITLVQDEKISDALQIIEGMPQKIESFLRKENNERLLASLPMQDE